MVDNKTKHAVSDTCFSKEEKVGHKEIVLENIEHESKDEQPLYVTEIVDIAEELSNEELNRVCIAVEILFLAGASATFQSNSTDVRALGAIMLAGALVASFYATKVNLMEEEPVKVKNDTRKK